MQTQGSDHVFERGARDNRVSIIVPLFNYAHHVVETLDSVLAQSTDDISLIVVDDCSTDNSVDTVHGWMQHQRRSRKGMLLVRNRANAKLSITRNTGIALSRSDYCFMLDADNILYPRCIEKHVEALTARPDADAAYSLLEVFEGQADVIGAGVFTKDGLKHGNFIDAMALFRRSMLLAMDGYENIRYGWEDYDLWLRMVNEDRIALHLPEILARYRQHNSSMLRTETNVNKNIHFLHDLMKKRHDWLELR
ncbi:glycosyltransferase [Sphingobium terrigena]|uniref:Glycosyltransferase n=1 Tax=Sphingobium terrigena TaxID=2304063 RepID=A0A418YJ96_9SPHN|nr:glycosyltransferase [Sphingobium terrigena]RJG50723.1 glycosyltransferase [Sphingobium terrigena]